MLITINTSFDFSEKPLFAKRPDGQAKTRGFSFCKFKVEYVSNKIMAINRLFDFIDIYKIYHLNIGINKKYG